MPCEPGREIEMQAAAGRRATQCCRGRIRMPLHGCSQRLFAPINRFGGPFQAGQVSPPRAVNQIQSVR